MITLTKATRARISKKFANLLWRPVSGSTDWHAFRSDEAEFTVCGLPKRVVLPAPGTRNECDQCVLKLVLDLEDE
jgi:hypothetical protein